MRYLLITLLSLLPSLLWANNVSVAVHDTESGLLLGHVAFSDSPYGLLITPNLRDLEPGTHGFHIHKRPDCSDGGKAAGGHFDPGKTSQHQGPYGMGHLGDLPALIVDKTGHAHLILLAPRLKLKDIYDRALVIHHGGDNYSDIPTKLGGGGKRIACGLIEKNQ